jgi:hypothetical protein
MAREHEESGSNQVLTPSGTSSEPRTGDDASAFGSGVVAALSLLTTMINEWTQLWSLRHKQGFPMQSGTQYLVGCAHNSA